MKSFLTFCKPLKVTGVNIDHGVLVYVKGFHRDVITINSQLDRCDLTNTFNRHNLKRCGVEFEPLALFAPAAQRALLT